MSKSILAKIVPRLYLGGEHAIREEWEGWLSQAGMAIIFTPNPEQVVLAHKDSAFAKELLEADILLPDGAGLILAARLLFPEISSRLGRITGTDLLDWWLGQAPEKETRTFLLGGKPGVAKKLARQSDPTAVWCEGFAGYENVAQIEPEEHRVALEAIKEWKTKVLWVAFGAPQQERWVLENSEVLRKMGVKLVIVCGGAFNYLVGDVSRAPSIVRKLGLEWMFRLITEPWRWKRQLRLPIFLYLFGKEVFEKLRLQAR
jgi:N-acetylglucosaminyldiphosphoundecaprenol N-acetyl-beta-D-mannosaminyltransferase